MARYIDAYILKKVMDVLPSEDVVEVVRCKDCRFYDAEYCRRLGLCGAFFANDFCSHSERRDDGKVH